MLTQGDNYVIINQFSFYFKTMSEKQDNLQKIANELEVIEGEQLTPNKLLVLQQSVAKKTNATELFYFLSVAKTIGLNPFNKEIWCYKDNKNNLIIFAGRDGLLRKAQSNPAFNGIRSMEVCENDEFSIDVANNKITHNIKDLLNRGKITGAYSIVFRKEGEPTIEVVNMKTYDKKYNTWGSHPEEMIKKVAESHALKKAFGITGVQIEDDFQVKNDVVYPLNKEVVEIEKPSLNDVDFNKFAGNSNEFIERHKDDYTFTDVQREQLAVRFNENE